MNHDWGKAELVVSTNKDKINIATVHEFLKTTYWAEKRSREQVEVSIKNSLCFGIYKQSEQIGFARVITDYITFASVRYDF